MNSVSRENKPRGRVLYDGDCPVCTGLARRFSDRLARMGFDVAPLGERNPEEMKVVTEAGAVLGGADGLVYLLGLSGAMSPLAFLFRLPGMMPAARRLYRWVAARRGCVGGRCAL